MVIARSIMLARASYCQCASGRTRAQYAYQYPCVVLEPLHTLAEGIPWQGRASGLGRAAEAQQHSDSAGVLPAPHAGVPCRLGKPFRVTGGLPCGIFEPSFPIGLCCQCGGDAKTSSCGGSLTVLSRISDSWLKPRCRSPQAVAEVGIQVADAVTRGLQTPDTFIARHTVAIDIVKGLVHMHNHGFLHGDIKPANVLVSIQQVTFENHGLTVSF